MLIVVGANVVVNENFDYELDFVDVGMNLNLDVNLSGYMSLKRGV